MVRRTLGGTNAKAESARQGDGGDRADQQFRASFALLTGMGPTADTRPYLTALRVRHREVGVTITQ